MCPFSSDSSPVSQKIPLSIPNLERGDIPSSVNANRSYPSSTLSKSFPRLIVILDGSNLLHVTTELAMNLSIK